ncbi:Outer-membrane lipoprotein carrier protein [bacterium HR33]|nr:Outer-membrane lipoprotein carrier protein [bacterium HR33]
MRPLLAAAGWLWATAAPAQQADLNSALARAQRAYDQMQTLRAEFTQTITNPMLGAPERSRGVLFLAPPDRFAMRFLDPEGDRIVADGRWLWLYTPSTVPDQVIRQPIPASGATTPNLFAQFIDRPLERYQASYLGRQELGGEAVDVVRFVPRERDMPFREAVLSLAVSDGWPRKLELAEPSGQRRELIFSKPAVNLQIAPEELSFTPPKGVRVVTP